MNNRMNARDFRMWLAKYDLNHSSLARKLDVTNVTIGNYVRNDRFPLVFEYALRGLALELEGE